MSDAPVVGSIRLYDAVQPDLEAGTYRVSSSLEIAKTDGTPLSRTPTVRHTYLEVVAPRFVLDPGECQGCQPPREGVGSYGDRLPHLVLGRRSLPWERRIDGSDAAPWLALLVLKRSELVDNRGTPFFTGKLSEQFPELRQKLGVSDDPQVTLLKVKDQATLKRLLPTRGELPLLAHVRQVNLADTELAGSDDDGWFAVVTGNRLPQEETDYLACLVSLEGRGDLWQLPDTAPPPALVVLFSWSFTSKGDEGTFERLVTGLDVAPFGAPGKGDAAVVDATGTVPVERVDHQGAGSPAAYRGPLLGLAFGQPLGTQRGDLSLEAAWQLGRLMAAADGHFLREMTQWHRTSETRARSALALAEVSRITAPHLHALGGEALAPTLKLRDLHNFVADLAAARPLVRVGTARGKKAVAAPARSVKTAAREKAAPLLPKEGEAGLWRSPGAHLLIQRLAALGALPEQPGPVRQRKRLAIGEGAGTETADLPDYVLHALARYHLLFEVPFPYLVPDSRLLPDGTIRFFTLDEAWLDALKAGALEHDITGSREQARMQLALSDFKRASVQQVGAVREVVRGRITLRAALTTTADPESTGTVSGFLLRSALVSGWPGLQVRGWHSADPVIFTTGADAATLEKTHPELVVKILRLERLSPSVLLVLFEGVPRLVWLEEPHQGIQFGADEGAAGTWTIPPRDPAGKPVPVPPVPVPFRVSAPGVVDVAQLATRLNTGSSSASLALQLMRPPVRQRFS